jgi:hypothetical protein
MMRALKIPRRKGAWRGVGDRQPMSRDLLNELRVVQRMPAIQIAQLLGYSKVQVRSVPVRHGITKSGQKLVADRLEAGEPWWHRPNYNNPRSTIHSVGWCVISAMRSKSAS